MNNNVDKFQQRLKKAQQLLMKNKESSMHSPNYIKIIIKFKHQYLIKTLLGQSIQSQTKVIAQFTAHNHIRLYQIYKIVRKKLDLPENQSLQIFFQSKIITNLNKTIKELRNEQNNQYNLILDIVKMEVF